MAFEYSDNLHGEDKGRYFAKLKIAGLDVCPYKIAGDDWINNPLKWPPIEFGNVYNYLIKSPRLYSTDAMENYRSLEAYKFLISGWVQTIRHVTTSSGFMVFKGDVRPSYRVTEDCHHPWLVLKSSGQVVAAHCDCAAGLGETCSHVGAMLFKMEAGVRLGFTTSACTDIACIWNQYFVKNVTPALVANINFYKAASKGRCQKSKRTRKSPRPPATEAQQEQFLASLASLGGKVVGLSSFSKYADVFSGRGPTPPHAQSLPKPLSALYKEGNELLDTQAISDLCNSAVVKVSAEEVARIEEVTRQQSSSSIWHDHRCGRITASVAFDCLRTNPLSPAPSLVKRICNRSENQLRGPAIAWGNEHEEDAFRLFGNVMGGELALPKTGSTGEIFLVGGRHEDLHIKKSGLVISEAKPHLGASPDGIITCKCCGNGVLELKCPFKHQSAPLKAAIAADRSFCLGENYQLKENHAYYAQMQMQMQMFVCDCQYGFLVVWTPVDCAIVHVSRNEDFILAMISKLDALWKTAVLPELLTRRMETDVAQPCVSRSALAPSPTSTSQRVYCIPKCQTPTNDENMVGCDKCDNWFHLTCLKLKRFPKSSTWYCKPCRKMKV